MPKLSQTVTPTTNVVQDVKLTPTVKAQLKENLKAYQAKHLALKALEKDLDDLKAKIGAVRDAAGVEVLEIDGYSVSLVVAERKTLDVMRLMANGVTQAIIDRSTVSSLNKPYEKISWKKDKA